MGNRGIFGSSYQFHVLYLKALRAIVDFLCPLRTHLPIISKLGFVLGVRSLGIAVDPDGVDRE